VKTRILKTKDRNRRRNIKAAARLLRKGELVAFPTETVYGLGANVFDPRAVRKIFRVKGRPADNPLIVHVWSIDQVHFLARSLPVMFGVLAARFMPGPLTVVLRKSEAVSKEVSSGLSTIAIRQPDHPVARALLKEAGVPIAAPSANLSGKPSPTKAAHVLEDLDGKIAAVLDGGPCRIGVESTVLDLTRRRPMILRPGAVTQEELEEVLETRIAVARNRRVRPPSPGMKYAHYAPKAEVIVVEGKKGEIVSAFRHLHRTMKRSRIVGVMAEESLLRLFPSVPTFSLGRDVVSAARNLFEGFRAMDRRNVNVILCQGFPEEQMGLALMNRMRKAATRRLRV